MQGFWAGLLLLALLGLYAYQTLSPGRPERHKQVRVVYLLNKLPLLSERILSEESWRILNEVFYDTWGMGCGLRTMEVMKEPAGVWINARKGVVVLSGEALVHTQDEKKFVRAGYLITSKTDAYVESSAEIAILHWTRENFFPE